jgi:hypothetical protein
MEKITKNTILKQGDKKFVALTSENVFYWRDEMLNIVAQSSKVIEGVPTINIFALENTSFKNFTLKDIEKTIDLAREYPSDVAGFLKEEIIEKVSQISEIVIDEQFNIIGYE